jgi:hypothetical protein
VIVVPQGAPAETGLVLREDPDPDQHRRLVQRPGADTGAVGLQPGQGFGFLQHRLAVARTPLCMGQMLGFKGAESERRLRPLTPRVCRRKGA